MDGKSVRTFYRYQHKNRPLGIIQHEVKCNNSYSSGTFRENLAMGDIPMRIIANLSVQNNQRSTGLLDSTIFPKKMEIEFIRVYQKQIQPDRYDLCGGDISGSEEICSGGQEVYTFNGDYDTIVWTTSSNLNSITNLNSVTISPIGTSFSAGWIKAMVKFAHTPCSIKTYTKTLHGGGQSITGTINQSSPNYFSQPLQTLNFITKNTNNTFTTFNVDLDNLTNTYNWQITKWEWYNRKYELESTID